MGKMQRTKGQVGEREFAKIIEDNLGVECKRIIEQTREGGHDMNLWNYAIEVKRAKKMNLSGWWKQTVENAREVGKIPVLAYRIDNMKWHVVMSFNDVLNIDGVETPERTTTFKIEGWLEYVKRD